METAMFVAALLALLAWITVNGLIIYFCYKGIKYILNDIFEKEGDV